MQTSRPPALTFAEYSKHDATALAELVRKGEVTPVELLETAIARADVVNPKLNAIVTPLYDKGRDMAKQLPTTGSFRGVPFLLKDLELEWAGTPLRSGCRGYGNYVSPIDSEVVKRLKAAGLVLFGKTNTPEFGLTPYTESKLYGPARNPWKPTHSPGGSSGGSAVAVAAGIVPAATASDGGGSIRIPAACCGLFGLKPSRGRVTLGPNFSEMWGGAVVSHAITRSVRDSAGLLDAIAGPFTGDPYGIAAPEWPFVQEVRREPGHLRIAFSTQALMEAQPTDPVCVKAVQDTARLLESLGHTVEEVPLPYEKSIVTKAFFLNVLSETAATLRDLAEFLGRPVRRDDVELNTWALSRMAASYSAEDVAYQKRRWNTLNRNMGQLHETYDVFLTPTLPRPPIAIGTFQNTATEERMLKLVDAVSGLKYLKGSKLVDELAEKSLNYIAYTVITNMTGQPSMSVPLHWSADGLPIGVMFAAKLGDEATLLRLAGQLEQAQPWFEKRPAL
ncbi:amidase [Spirosoma utsteinense]|uniref:Amidase n=1 Tax=Spirosoma utsteinense TaxID=2585773 RepID=A0ABR6W342_9BACT|nr:amidase [Spirosoma utsteinense]MBC3786641.1 amidase [Spirosoma utsteinense]MBC3791004.1 amidase [Spirosoma utsteinense]